jgi:hypothetical protein
MNAVVDRISSWFSVEEGWRWSPLLIGRSRPDRLRVTNRVKFVGTSPAFRNGGHDEYQSGQPERRIGRFLISKVLGRRRVTLVVRQSELTMERIRAAPLVAGFCLLGALGVFPPLKPAPNTNFGDGWRQTWQPRGFLFEAHTIRVRWKEEELQVTAELDTGRLLAEALIVIGVSGSAALVLSGSPSNKA